MGVLQRSLRVSRGVNHYVASFPGPSRGGGGPRKGPGYELMDIFSPSFVQEGPGLNRLHITELSHDSGSYSPVNEEIRPIEESENIVHSNNEMVMHTTTSVTLTQFLGALLPHDQGYASPPVTPPSSLNSPGHRSRETHVHPSNTSRINTQQQQSGLDHPRNRSGHTATQSHSHLEPPRRSEASPLSVAIVSSTAATNLAVSENGHRSVNHSAEVEALHSDHPNVFQNSSPEDEFANHPLSQNPGRTRLRPSNTTTVHQTGNDNYGSNAIHSSGYGANDTATQSGPRIRLSEQEQTGHVMPVSMAPSTHAQHGSQSHGPLTVAIHQQATVAPQTEVASVHQVQSDSSGFFHTHAQQQPALNSTRTELSFENEVDYHQVNLACKCLHANDYNKMIEVLLVVETTIAGSFGLGLAYYKLKKFSASISYFLKMEELSYADGTKVANVYLSLYYRGEISFSKRNYLEAANLFHKSVSAFSSSTVAVRYRITPPSKSVVYAKEGASFRHGQRILEAVKAYKNAISVAESKRDKLSACTSLGNMYQSLGENVLALEQYEVTIQLAKELGDHVSLGWAHGNMGNAYLGLQQKDKALHHLKEALELAVTYETTPQAIGRTYNNLGTAYQSLNDLDKAEEYYDLALSQAVYGNDVGGQARVYGNFGNVLMLKKEYDRAIVHYTEAHNLSNDKATKTTALHNRGCASYEKGETSKKKYLIREGVRASDITYDGRSMKDSRHPRPDLPESVLKSYRNGHKDLAKVIQRHEESFQTIKGSTHGLTLSVSLFESNSRTFHRVQDCLYNLGEFEKALEFAEQSRTRSLGELMFERCGKYQQNPLCSPMNIDQIFTIIKSLKSEKVDVVYISYTGARIIVWVISPINSHVEINLFQVSLQDDQFEGKSLDYFLRYSLNELLIENHVELYSFCDYKTASEVKYLSTLNDIFGKPLLTILEAVRGRRSIYDIILITDSYTHLMPVPTLFDTLSHQFLGDRLRVRYMPSLLTMGIMVKMPKVIVEVSEESQKFCIVGNPTIPMFQYQGESWRLGKLPFATKEAEWVAHILKTTPTLHEQATKMIILSMINSAKVVHLATHGSATAGFLAFAGLGSSRTREVTDEKTVLLYPEEVEKLHISPALVVLSSCDSGRGTVKADGIQGMARAFILAGAQSVLTTMWRIHDESASTFMKFFYQYLMDGFRSSVALHKASLSVRCFAKYSHFVHWSGYQLTGREIQLNVHMSSKDRAVLSKVGITPSFPRLDIVKKLETAFLKDPVTPTDIQLIHGFHGLKPSEPVIDFIKKHHSHFTGGVFFVSGAAPELVEAAEEKLKKALSGIFPLTAPLASTPHILVIFDNISTIPLTEFFKGLLRNSNTHVIITFNPTQTPKDLIKTIDRELIRGTTPIDLKPLSSLLTTQRLVHSIMKGCDTDDFVPYNEEQRMISLITEQTGGSPDIIDIASTVLAERLAKGDVEQRRHILEEICEETIVVATGGERSQKEEATKAAKAEARIEPDCGSATIVSTESIARNSQTEEKKSLNQTTVVKFTTNLLQNLDLSQSDHFLLKALHWFGTTPIPRQLIENFQSIIVSASKHQRPTKTPMVNLLSYKLLQVYPSTVIVKPAKSQLPYSSTHSAAAASLNSDSTTAASLNFIADSDFYYVPQLVIDSVQDQLQPMDRDFSLTAAFKALNHYCKESDCDLTHATGLANVLYNKIDEDNVLFQVAYRLYLSLVTRTGDQNYYDS